MSQRKSRKAAPTTKSNDYHSAQTVEELTAANVKTIAELERAADQKCSRADRVAAAITGFCGSMSFVWVHVVWFTVWILWNTVWQAKPLDPYPFSFLTLVVSLEAIFLSTFIMISENRQGRLEERRSHLDLQINLLSEQENTKMLQLLTAIAKKLQVEDGKDPSVAVLEQATRPDALLQQIDEVAAEAERQDEPGKC
ncbi:MAG TPA: DUF1003 domain-containing protein [Chthoniobacteraceae bacterium]|jgi:uncharacterized membrane protein|nr:DUF1003 domain-containing protein [Chthoniobacteraceae bacterium]